MLDYIGYDKRVAPKEIDGSVTNLTFGIEMKGITEVDIISSFVEFLIVLRYQY
jgi:hypothetical protein